MEKNENIVTNANKSGHEKRNVPTLRFKEHTDEWHKFALSDFVTRITRRNKNNESSLPLTISAQYGLVDQITFFNKTVASVDLSGYYLLYNGDFAYNKSYSNDYAWGAVKRLDKYDKGCLSSLYFVFRPTDKVNSDYLTHYFETSKWHKGISDIAGEGARNHGLLNIAVEDYFATQHYLPSLPEQKKIANFLNLITKRIEVQNKIISKYETLIKGISYDYFSKQPDYTTKLENLILKGKAGGTPSSTVAEYYDGNIPFLSISDMTKQGKYVKSTEKHISESGLANSSAWIVPSKSLILSMYASVGLVCINTVPLATSQAMFSMVLKDCKMLDYIYYYLNFFRETQIHRLLETGTQSNINANTVRHIEIVFYSNISILVKTLQAIEHRLNNEKDILSRLMDLKTYLLSNLFI